MDKKDFEILMNSLYSNNQLFIPQGQNIKEWIDNAFVEKKKEAINYSQCSTQLKRVDIISFEEWKKRFVVKTETNNVYEFRGDFVLGTDLEFAYNKDVELYNSLIV